ncbi:MAG: hypothetical protein AB7G25_13085 [Sphingomonadaceae bacterium]
MISVSTLIMLAGCSDPPTEADAESTETSGQGDDLFDTEADTDGEKGDETYSEFDARRDSIAGTAGYSGGYGCTEDCSGHDAGRQWAEDHGVSDESECGGKSWSFQEGCVSYVEEQSISADDEDTSGEY